MHILFMLMFPNSLKNAGTSFSCFSFVGYQRKYARTFICCSLATWLMLYICPVYQVAWNISVTWFLLIYTVCIGVLKQTGLFYKPFYCWLLLKKKLFHVLCSLCDSPCKVLALFRYRRAPKVTSDS